MKKKIKNFLDIYVTKKHEEYQYLNILKKLIDKGVSSGDRTGTGTYKLFGEKMEFDLSEGTLPIITTRKIPHRLVVEELLWFMSGSTNVKHLQEKNVKIWDGNGSKEECAKFGREEGDLGPIYGHQWRNFNATKRREPLKEDYYSELTKRWVHKEYNDDGFDQIKYVVDQLINNPNSRRILFSGWHAQEAHDVNPPPCHTLYQFQVIEGKLNAILYMRSSDFFLAAGGFNIPSLAIFVHVLCQLCNLKPGKLVYIAADTHLYKDHIEQAKMQIQRKPYPYPTVSINSRLHGKGFDGLMDLKFEDIKINNYKAHSSIKAKMSV